MRRFVTICTLYTLCIYCDMLSGRPNYLMQEIPIARQRIRITYPRIQLTSQSQQLGYCYNLVTGCKHAGILATNRPIIDNNGSPRLYKELMIDYRIVWSWESARAGRDSSSSEQV
jgi:hypothetical protein